MMAKERFSTQAKGVIRDRVKHIQEALLNNQPLMPKGNAWTIDCDVWTSGDLVCLHRITTKLMKQLQVLDDSSLTWTLSDLVEIVP